jgi:hypothetical protein
MGDAMSRRPLLWAFIAGGVLVGMVRQTGAQAEDTKASGDAQNIRSQIEKAAQLPNFAETYGLEIESLLTLGNRLTDARMKADPVAIALVSTEMAVSEKVSGKKANLTSSDVMKEATDLAKLRSREKELAAVALLVKDQTAAKELADLADAAKRTEAERIAAFKSGERQKGVHFLEVINNTHHNLSIRVNGQHVGWVPQYSVGNFELHPMHHGVPQLFLSAHDHFGNHVRAHAATGHHHRFTWTIFEQ